MSSPERPDAPDSLDTEARRSQRDDLRTQPGEAGSPPSTPSTFNENDMRRMFAAAVDVSRGYGDNICHLRDEQMERQFQIALTALRGARDDAQPSSEATPVSETEQGQGLLGTAASGHADAPPSTSIVAEVTRLLEQSGLSDDLEFDGTLTIYDGRAHVAYISNHQSGERGRDVARLYVAIPRLLRGLLAERETLTARASTLEDAAFHFQTCATCCQDGEENCISGRQFAAFLRGEEMEGSCR